MLVLVIVRWIKLPNQLAIESAYGRFTLTSRVVETVLQLVKMALERRSYVYLAYERDDTHHEWK